MPILQLTVFKQKRFKNTFKFSDSGINKYILLLAPKKRCLSLWVYGWMGKV